MRAKILLHGVVFIPHSMKAMPFGFSASGSAHVPVRSTFRGQVANCSAEVAQAWFNVMLRLHFIATNPRLSIYRPFPPEDLSAPFPVEINSSFPP